MDKAGGAEKLRILVIPAAVLALIGGAWLGGETFLAGKVRTALGQSPDLAVETVAPLRDPTRFGLALENIGFNDGKAQVSAPDLRFWISPLSPTTLRAALPAAIEIAPSPATDAAGEAGVSIALKDGLAAVKLSPLHDMQLTRFDLDAGGIALNGRELAQAVSARAALASLAHDSPKAAGAAYDLDLSLAALDPESLPALQNAQLPEGMISLSMKGRVWLEDAVTPLAGAEPVAVGLRSDHGVISVGDLTARIVGRLEEDEAGFVAGTVMIYTADARPLLEFLASIGVIPEKTIPLGLTLLRGISRAGVEADGGTADRPLLRAGLAAATDAASRPDETGTSDGYPLPADDEIRLPLTFRDGKAMLGPIALGPAPRFPR